MPCQWPTTDWAVRLVPLMTGKARSAYVSMDQESTGRRIDFCFEEPTLVKRRLPNCMCVCRIYSKDGYNPKTTLKNRLGRQSFLSSSCTLCLLITRCGCENENSVAEAASLAAVFKTEDSTFVLCKVKGGQEVQQTSSSASNTRADKQQE